MKAAVIFVLATLPDRDTALRVAQTLIGDRLAACVSVGAPVESIYHWRGKVETAKEVPVAIKTRQDRYAAVEKVIRGLSSYELPEIVVVPINDGYAPYLDWIATESAPAD